MFTRTRLRLPFAAALGGFLSLSAAAWPMAADSAEAAQAPRNVSIPFAAHHGVENWEADGSRGIWIQARNRKWYYAKFFSTCSGLQFREALRFKFGPSGELDRWSEVYTPESGHCRFATFEPSDGPPAAKPGKDKAGAAPAAPVAPAQTPPAS